MSAKGHLQEAAGLVKAEDGMFWTLWIRGVLFPGEIVYDLLEARWTIVLVKGLEKSTAPREDRQQPTVDPRHRRGEPFREEELAKEMGIIIALRCNGGDVLF